MSSIDTSRPTSSSASGASPSDRFEAATAPAARQVRRLRRTFGMLGELPAPLLALVDATALAAACLLVPADIPLLWRVATIVALFVGLSIRHTHRAGTGRVRPTTLLLAITTGGLSATAGLLAARSLMPSGPAAPDLLILGVAATLTVVVLRSALQVAARHARRSGAGTVPTLIVGAGIIGRQLERRMRQHPELGFTPVGFLDDDPSPLGQLDAGRPALVLGPTAALPEVIQRSGARHVVFSFTRAPDSEVLPLLRECQREGIDVSVMPRLFENVNGRVRVEQLAGLPLLALRQTNPRGWQFLVKHGSDRLFAAALLLLLSPLLACIALAVRLSSPGSVLYRQERVGRDGRAFKLLKFRSMRPSTDPVDLAVIERLEIAGLGPGGIEGEDRRTPIGRFLRRSGLDELPQLVNVLRGEMSIVGPRPERPEFADRFGERLRRYDDRHLVRAGITGWAQVNGLRGQTSIAERIEWDNWYIQNWSLGLDLLSLALTPLAILRTPSEEEAAGVSDAAAVDGN
ncbi:MAG: sugar transferase [Solirubrobacteraceae bacterium]|nr:sugar transferase [Solirubrobacteraceae bacterium]